MLLWTERYGPLPRNAWEHGDCERGAEYAARILAAAPSTRNAVRKFGLAPMLSAIRLQPFRPDDGLGCEGGLQCGPVVQRLAFARNGWNCFERAVAGAALLRNAGIPHRILTKSLPDGQLHTVVAVQLRNAEVPLDLDAALRNAEWQDVARPIISILHTIGSAILTGYGMKPLADALGGLWQSVGLLPKTDDNKGGGGLGGMLSGLIPV